MNQMKLTFKSILENEAFARTSAVAFLMPLNPSVDEVMEIKTMIAEAIVNAMIHGYENVSDGEITLEMSYDEENCVYITVHDDGVGIANIEEAKQPLFTTKEHLERSGMGMTIMETFSDTFEVLSTLNQGTTLHIKKQLKVHG